MPSHLPLDGIWPDLLTSPDPATRARVLDQFDAPDWAIRRIERDPQVQLFLARITAPLSEQAAVGAWGSVTDDNQQKGHTT